ncbi:hypothetical protein EV714DRAFT_278567 [Schizophyllum commune]
MLPMEYGEPTTPVHHMPNLPLDGTQLQRAIPSDEASTRITLRRPRNALEPRNPTLAKTNLLNCAHLPLIPSAFPLSSHNSGRMQAYSEVLKRYPEAWKTAQPSRSPRASPRS